MRGGTQVKFDYHTYLAGREWGLLKKQVRERSGGRCERCGAEQQATHHLTYERLGHERLEDLQAVCRPCHEYLSGISDVDPGAKSGVPMLFVFVPRGDDSLAFVRLYDEVVEAFAARTAGDWQVYLILDGRVLRWENVRVEISGELAADLESLVGEENVVWRAADGRRL